MVFDEKHTYKDRKDAVEEKKQEFIELDPVRNGEIPRVQTEDENSEDVEEEDVVETDSHMHTSVPQPVSPQLRRTTRVTKPLQRYSANDYVLYTDSGEPEYFVEAIQDKAKVKWELAMKEKMDSLKQNITWDLMKLPASKKALFNK